MIATIIQGLWIIFLPKKKGGLMDYMEWAGPFHHVLRMLWESKCFLVWWATHFILFLVAPQIILYHPNSWHMHCLVECSQDALPANVMELMSSRKMSAYFLKFKGYLGIIFFLQIQQ